VKNDDETFNIDWQGDIALSYAGEEKYAHSFTAHIKNVKFGGIAAAS